jgi:hypothetical protein
MKKLIRFFAFFLALSAAAGLSAQTSEFFAPTKNSGTQPVTKEYISMNDYAVIDILEGSISYQVYIKKEPEAAWMLVDARSNISSGDPNSDAGSSDADVMIEQPDSYQLRVIVASQCDACATLIFKS